MQFRSDGRHTGTPHSPAFPAQPNTTPALYPHGDVSEMRCRGRSAPRALGSPSCEASQPHSLGDTEAKQSTTAVDSLQNSLPSPQDSAQNVNESQTKQTPTPQWERELPTVPQLPWLLFQTQHHMQGKMKRSEIAPDVLIQPWGAPGWVCSALRNNTSVEHGRNGLV